MLIHSSLFFPIASETTELVTTVILLILILFILSRFLVFIENRQGITPLMVAASQGSLESLQLLLAKGCDTTRRDYTGRTALMWAEWSRKNRIVRALKHAGVRE